jgi:hypothetical protein
VDVEVHVTQECAEPQLLDVRCAALADAAGHELGDPGGGATLRDA